MKLILAIVRPFKVADIVDAVESDPSFPGMTVLDCRGFGREKSAPHRHSVEEDLKDFVDRSLILVAAPDDRATAVSERIEAVARTGQPGDGKVFVLSLEQAVRIATADTGDRALR
ncbi:MAG: P-II family nitrogen regulator, partial [Gemmatimonadales bacterium]